MNETFDPNAYWRNRVGDDATVGVVGHRSLGVSYNEYIYQRRVDVLNELLVDLGIDATEVSLLDIGCGSGFYTEYWRHRGVSNYLGIDLSPDTVRRLTDEYPDFEFRQADVTVDAGEPDRRFSIVTVFDVFYHIVDDDKVLAAFRNIRKQLGPDAIVIVFEQLTAKDYVLRKHVRFRGRGHYRDMLAEAGLEITETRHLFNILVPPLTGYRWIDIPIAGVYKALGFFMTRVPFLGRMFGKFLYLVDRLLFRLGVKIPNNELFVLRSQQPE